MLRRAGFTLSRSLFSSGTRKIAGPRCLSSFKPYWSYFHQTSSTSKLNTTIAECLLFSNEKSPDHIACIDKGIGRSYRQLQEEVDEMAAGLLELGLNPGDRVGLYMPNCYEWVVAFFAVAKAGLISVLLNPASQEKELEYLLNKVGCKALFIQNEFKSTNYIELLKNLEFELDSSAPGSLHSSRVPSLHHVITISEKDPPLRGVWRFKDVTGNNSGSVAFHRLATLQRKISPDDPASILFTSGTTGYPKAATLNHVAIVNDAYFTAQRAGMGVRSEHVFCCSPPLFHIFGCILINLASVQHGQTCVLPSPSFDPISTLEAVHKEKCTVLFGTPTMLLDIFAALQEKKDKYSLETVKLGLTGGAPISTQLLSTWQEFLASNNAPLKCCYGLTEGGAASLTKDRPDVRENGRIYMPLIDHIEVKIVDEEGGKAPFESVGEVWMRGPFTYLGYWPELGKAQSDSGWLRTGDLGTLDVDGNLSIVGRIKDMVIRGGENIYPSEVEGLLRTYPGIHDLAVIGLPDSRMGEELCVWVQFKHKVSCTEEEFKAYFKGKISHFKIPKYIVFVDHFPLTTSGKINKSEIQRLSLKIFGLDQKQKRQV